MKKAVSIISLLALTVTNLFSQQNDFPIFTGSYLGQTPPGMTLEIFNQEAHSAAVFSPDGKELYLNLMSSRQILFMKMENNKWLAPPEVPFALSEGTGDPALSPDGEKLFYGTERPLPGKTELNPRTNIWVVEKADGTWGTPYHIGPPASDVRPMYVSSTNDGTLYLTGNKQRGIYRSVFKNGKYSIPERLPEKNKCKNV